MVYLFSYECVLLFTFKYGSMIILYKKTMNNITYKLTKLQSFLPKTVNGLEQLSFDLLPTVGRYQDESGNTLKLSKKNVITN